MKVENILILGVLPHDDSRRALYGAMTEVCCRYAGSVSSPLDFVGFGSNRRERYKHVSGLVDKTSFVVADHTRTALKHGVGIEYSLRVKKPMVATTLDGIDLPEEIELCPSLFGNVIYENLDDLRSGLNRMLGSLSPQRFVA